ncbi:hypothetical protein BC939DRAFT_448274 [Gamsiella multidivaricata]|uniref:uncharacterized protein n=1 Tax=Gamsiella multidivaricata TaxID=101098 RepID=UPI00222023E1|nr:uncharacterized protein BC939DRAFT_448274 [Gamsiella multidivaricata]KAG0353555.1 hypothetical protein BGZ54_002203 [Gamsiella multidivaricata]KAI7825737.1 hypothetical protein BC939DRAFT_448274 [Gamsiella multidivaricata]
MSFPTYLGNSAFWKTFFTPDRYSYDKIPDLSGKVAIVTGANAGIGYAITVGLASRGAHVIMACRSESKCTKAMAEIRDEIKAKFPDAPKDVQLEFLELDLNDLNKVKAAAETFLSRGLPLHILINNAGIMGTPWRLSADGIEEQFAVNYLATFVFTMGLLDKLKESQPSRIVLVNSVGHEMSVSGGINIDRINDESEGHPSARYGRSKFASMLFMKSLTRRLASEQIYVNSAHPGIVDTEMCRHSADAYGCFLTQIMRLTAKTVAYTPAKGALTPLYCATSPEIEEKAEKDSDVSGIRGKFFIPIANELRPSKLTESVELQEKVWAYTEKLISEKLNKKYDFSTLMAAV